MKLTFSPASPFARKVRIAAIELGLIDKIEFVPTAVAPGQPNDEYSQINPLKKLPALILDNGDVIINSYVIVEYLDELAGGGKLIPASGPDTVEGQERSFAAAGHARFHAAVPLRENGAAAGVAVAGVVRRSLEPGLDRHGALRKAGGRAVAPARHRADRARLRARLCRFPLSPIAAGARPIRSSMHSIERMLSRPSVKISVPPPA